MDDDGTVLVERRVPAGAVELAVQQAGSGPPVVLVHGSLDDHRAWDRVVPLLLPHRTVVTYDRRGHGHSTCPPGQGRIGEDAEDLAALITHLRLERPLVVGHSYGSTVALLLGATRPDLTGGLLVHEPPLFGLLAEDEATRPLAERAGHELRTAALLIEQGRVADGVRHFVDSAAFGPGTWDAVLTPRLRKTFVAHAGTWLDQFRDPERLAVRPERLAAYPHALTISQGDRSLPAYAAVVDRVLATVPAARRRVVRGAGHAPHLTHPAEFAALVRAMPVR